MPRRTFNRAEVYVDQELYRESASVTYDTGHARVEVKVGTDKTTFDSVVSFEGPTKRGRDRVRTWTLADGRVITAITAGCNCGR